MKELTAPEIRRLIKAHNVLTKITIPKGAKKVDLIKLINDAGFKLDHEAKKITKMRKGKQDIADGTSIDLPAGDTPEQKAAKKAKAKAAKDKKAAEIKAKSAADIQKGAALGKLVAARRMKKDMIKNKATKPTAATKTTAKASSIQKKSAPKYSKPADKPAPKKIVKSKVVNTKKVPDAPPKKAATPPKKGLIDTPKDPKKPVKKKLGLTGININTSPQDTPSVKDIQGLDLKKDEPPPKKIVKEIADMSVEEIVEISFKNRIDGSKLFVPFKGSKNNHLLYMLYTLGKNKNDCGVNPKLMADIFNNAGGSKKVIRNNMEEIQEAVARCAKRGKMLCVPVKRSGHANMLIFNFHRKEVERFEPHGYSDKKGTDKDNLGLGAVIKDMNKYFKKELGYEFKYMKPKQVSNQTIKDKGDWEEYQGFQYSDRSRDMPKNLTFKNVVITSAGGYCMAWGYFYLDLRLKFPKLSGGEIITKSFDILMSDTAQQAGRQRFRNMVIGMTDQIYKWGEDMVKKGFITEEKFIKGIDQGGNWKPRDKSGANEGNDIQVEYRAAILKWSEDEWKRLAE